VGSNQGHMYDAGLDQKVLCVSSYRLLRLNP
jgi:hypothetical protein